MIDLISEFYEKEVDDMTDFNDNMTEDSNDDSDTDDMDNSDDWDDFNVSSATEDEPGIDFNDLELNDSYNGRIAISIKCACHTLQLSVHDVMKSTAMIKKISKCRALAKKLRTPNVATILKNMNLRQAKIDVPTRWCSAYDMMERLIELKPFCVEFEDTQKECKLSKSSWEFIQSFVVAFAPVKVHLKKLYLNLVKIFIIFLESNCKTPKRGFTVWRFLRNLVISQARTRRHEGVQNCMLSFEKFGV